MRGDGRHPSGATLVASWTRSRSSDLGLIAVPGEAEPVVLAWTAYTRPGPGGAGRREFLGTLWHGGRPLLARERVVYTRAEPGRTLRWRGQHVSEAGVCCTELVRVLAGGGRLALTRIEGGLWQGLWQAEAASTRRSRAGAVVERVCRLVLDLERGRALLVRWRSVRDPHVTPPSPRIRLGRRARA